MKKIFSVLTGLAVAAVLTAPLNAGGMEADSAAAGKALGGFDLSSAQLRVPVPPAPAMTAAGVPAEINLWDGYLSTNFGGIKASVQPYFAAKNVPETSRVMERVDLEEILNANLKTKLTFKTSSGNTVHVSGALARNCADGGNGCSENDRYFLVFHTDKGQTLFVKGQDIANLLFKSGKREIAFDGDSEKYVVRLFVKISSPSQSRLKVETQGRMVLDISLEQLTAALAETGKRLSVGSRHNLFYNSEVLQDKDGNGYFGKGRVVTFSPNGPAPNQYVSASQITAAGVILNTVEAQFGFRIVNGVLEIYQA